MMLAMETGTQPRLRQKPNRRLSVAPMMNHTDRHFRTLLRLISRHIMLYTEMITTGALLYGSAERYLAHAAAERPLGLQLGGSDPEALARCAQLAEATGFNEVNLNVGCPSDRVQEARFGACLMAEPTLVAECIAAMAGAVAIPITVKTRIGIDDRDRYEDLTGFIATVSAAGCNTFVIHARKAWLKGLSPRENRHLPPLQYSTVYQLKCDFPDLEIILNGGISSLDEVATHLQHVDGVMIGRAACSNPYLLQEVDRRIFGDPTPPRQRQEVMRQYVDYAAEQVATGVSVHHVARHATGLFQGLPGARAFRRHLSEQSCRPGAGVNCLREAMELVAAA
jgi:tRNA-dihydrouridine synthase A